MFQIEGFYNIMSEIAHFINSQIVSGKSSRRQDVLTRNEMLIKQLY